MNDRLTDGISDAFLYSVLYAIDLEGGLIPLAGVPELAAEITRGGKNLFKNYELALQDCLAHGWIKILTAADCQEDQEHWAASRHEQWAGFLKYRPGGIDFTQAGWEVYRHLKITRLGSRWQEKYVNVVESFQPSQETISLVSGSKTRLLHELQQVRIEYRDVLIGSDLEQEKLFNPTDRLYTIGPWWIKRFYRLSSAYRIDITVRPFVDNIGRFF